VSSTAKDAAATPTTAVRLLVGLVAAAAVTCLAASAGLGWHEISAKPITFTGFIALTVALQLMAVRVRGRGAISVAGIAFLATGFTLGVGAAMASAVIAALVHALRSRPLLHRAIFNAGTFSLAAAAGTALYHLLENADSPAVEQLGIAFLSGGVFAVVNVSLLTVAMSVSEARSVIAVWNERLRWLTPHYLGFGVLALASTLAYEEVGFLAVLAFPLLPALLVFRAALPRRLRLTT
jgi:hypothetical protein